MPNLVYLNGDIVALDDARVSVTDRGFMLADGIYEVIRVYGGRPFCLDAHLRRLARSARELQLDLDPGIDELERICADLLRRNEATEASLYLQVTRGAAPRGHAFPSPCPPTTLVMVVAAARPDAAVLDRGVAAITVPDDRWARCDIKTIGLTANVLAKQRAVQSGAYEAIFVRDGMITDGASSNIFAVIDGTVVTAPRTNYILAGITRDVVLEVARAADIPVREEPFRVEALRAADEVFLTATTSEILPIVHVDGAPVGSGRPGPVTGQLITRFQQRTAAGG